MQCNICSESEAGEKIEMEPIIKEKCFICDKCRSITYISFIIKNKNNSNNELNNFA